MRRGRERRMGRGEISEEGWEEKRSWADPKMHSHYPDSLPGHPY